MFYVVRHPRGSDTLIVYPLLSLQVATQEKKSIQWTLSICESASNVVLSRMQLSPFMRLAQHLTALRTWCKKAMSAWSVKTRRAPSRHCRDARVHGHTTTAMHGMSTPPNPPPPRCTRLVVLFPDNVPLFSWVCCF